MYNRYQIKSLLFKMYSKSTLMLSEEHWPPVGVEANHELDIQSLFLLTASRTGKTCLTVHTTFEPH